MNKKNLFSLLIFILLIASINVFANSTELCKDQNDFRDYQNAPETVREFYRQNHINQTLNFVLAQKKKYYPLNKMRMTIWEAMEKLDAIVDESDPDLDNAQTVHAFQTAQDFRKI